MPHTTGLSKQKLFRERYILKGPIKVLRNMRYSLIDMTSFKGPLRKRTTRTLVDTAALRDTKVKPNRVY